jgi:opacity protein-like surface antigen
MSIRKGVALALALVAPAAYAADTPSWYVGLNGGQSEVKSKDGGIDSAFASQGFATSSSIEKHDSAFSLNAGMQINRWVGVEAEYVDFGKFDFGSDVSAPVPGAFGGQFKAHGFGVNLVGTLPLQNGFSVYGKAGVMRSKAELEPSSTIEGRDHNRTGGMFGVGGSYTFARNWSGRLEWDRYLKIGDAATTGRSDIDLVMAGVRYTF